GAGIVERHMFDRFDSKILSRKRGRERAREVADVLDGVRVRIRSINFVPFAQEIDKVAAGTASGIQDSHSGRDAAFQKLVEKIDVDLAELLLKRGRGHFDKSNVG